MATLNTRKQKEKDIDKKVREFIRESGKHMRKNIKRAINSGALDISSHDGNYNIPRTIFLALLKEEGFQYKFHCLDDKERKRRNNEVENVYNMM